MKKLMLMIISGMLTSGYQLNRQDYAPHSPISQNLQWHQNYGYCGETSFITTGLALGQYTSQFEMRHLASSGGTQEHPDNQLLLGINDESTASKVGYKYAEQSNCTIESKAFLEWIKTQLYQGHPVIIGVYLNEYLFYRNQTTSEIPCLYNPDSNSCVAPLNCVPTGIPDNTSSQGTCQYGDPEYDHIVTVTSISTTRPCTGIDQCEYDDNDTITIDDHGLYDSECDYGNPALQCPSSSTQVNLCTTSKTLQYKYLYTYSFREFQKSRKAANSPLGSVYSLNNTPTSGNNCLGNYGIAIRGLKGEGLLPINVTINENFECDMVQDGSSVYYPVSGIGSPVNRPIVLKVTVSNMEKGRQYNLYQYDDFSRLPLSGFNQHAADAHSSWVIESATGTVTKLISITNNQTAIFRAVRTDAP